MQFTNAACADATTEHILGRQSKEATRHHVLVPGRVATEDPDLHSLLWCGPSYPDAIYELQISNIEYDARGYTRIDYQCALSLRPQIEAITADTDLVLFTMGGNDANFWGIIQRCLVPFSRAPDECRAVIEKARAELPIIQARIENVLTAMLRRLHPGARLVYLAYPHLERNPDYELQRYETLLSEHGFVSVLTDRYPAGRAVRELGVQGEKIQKDAVAAAGDDRVIFIDTVKQHFAGHEPDARLGVQSPDPWLFPYSPDRTLAEWYHPNPAGHRAIAALLQRHGDFGASSAAGDRAGPSAPAQPVSNDHDNDEVPAAFDNCPTVSNHGQLDFDRDGLGDRCDPQPGYPIHDRPGVKAVVSHQP